MKHMQRLGLILSVLLMTACGVGLEDSGSDSARDQKNEKLRDEYEAVKGTYEGYIRITGVSQKFRIKFYVFWGEVQGEPLPGDLKPGLRVVLRGRLMQSDFVGDSDNLILTGLYDSVTGSMMLDPDLETSKTSTGCRLGGQDPVGIRGKLAGKNIEAVVLRNGQEWARFEGVHFVSKDVSTGSVLSEEEEYSRLQKVYEPVTGTYSGRLSRQLCEKGKPSEEEFSLLMYIERRQEGAGSNGTPCYVPRLTARTFRYYDGELADVTYRSVTRFDPQNFLPQFQSVNVVGASPGSSAGGGAGSSAPRASVLELATHPNKSGGLIGTISTSGHWGDIELKRDTDKVVAPDDEVVLLRQRRLQTYGRFTGDYKGQVVAYSPSACDDGSGKKLPKVCTWDTGLRLYQDEANVNGARIPILMAYYTRELRGTDPSIGSRLMQVDVTMDSCKPLLVMQSDGSAMPSPIPGVGRMHFSAEYNNGEMKGELVDHRGPQGIMTVRKR